MENDGNILEAQRQRILAREQPFGLRLDADLAMVEYGHPDCERLTLARWTPVLTDLGAMPWTVRDRLSAPTRELFGTMPWVFRPLADGEHIRPPLAVQRRLKALEAAGVPLTWWVYGEEDWPRLVLDAPERVPERGVKTMMRQVGHSLRTAGTLAADIGAGASTAFAGVSGLVGSAIDGLLAIDPVLIGVVPTALAPDRGLWVVVGKWGH